MSPKLLLDSLVYLWHALLHSMPFILGYMWGKWDKPALMWTLHLFKFWRFRLGGWKKVVSPWPLYEKTFPGGITHRAVSHQGMRDADKRYRETKSPEPKF